MGKTLASQMRQAMRRLASGVSILSATDHLGSPVAITVSSVTSVSDAPASLLVCVSHEARIGEVIQNSKRFAINVLAAEQEPLSRLCADPSCVDERYTDAAWSQDAASQLWFLESAPSVVFCELSQTVAYGKHAIFIGNVIHTHFSSSASNELLLYLNGGYRQLGFEP